MAIIDWREMNSELILEKLRTGDVIAFGGNALLSNLIKFFTRSEVSHAGTIVIDEEDGVEPALIESVGDFEKDPPVYGVRQRPFSETLREYDGEIWWLPLGDQMRESEEAFNQQTFADVLEDAEGEEYDLEEAFLAVAVDSVLEWIGLFERDDKEDFEKFFCSELVAMALEKAGAVGPINASTVTPIDLCRWSIYQENYYLLAGKAVEIGGFNTLEPEQLNPEA